MNDVTRAVTLLHALRVLRRLHDVAEGRVEAMLQLGVRHHQDVLLVT